MKKISLVILSLVECLILVYVITEPLTGTAMANIIYFNILCLMILVRHYTNKRKEDGKDE